MTKPHSALNQLTPELLLRAYASGIFPMSEARDDPNIFWVDPRLRAVLPLDAFHVSRSLAKTVRKKVFQISCDTAFADVINACAASTQERQETWINDEIINAYTELHHMGFAHSVECRRDGALVGGLYGVSIGAAFCGESMFHTATDASKVALVHLVARLKLGGYVLLDTQFVTDHLKQFGIIEIPARKYLTRLDKALEIEAAFPVEIDPREEEKALEELFS